MEQQEDERTKYTKLEIRCKVQERFHFFEELANLYQMAWIEPQKEWMMF